MSLIACKPVAQIYIGLNLFKIRKLGIDVYQALYSAQKLFEVKFKHYQICTYPSSKFENENEHEIIIINAHLNYEVVKYSNKKITYPELENQIHGAIEQFFNSTKHQSPTEADIALANKVVITNINLADQYQRTLNKVNELNSCKPNGFAYCINHGESLEIIAQNYRNEIIFIATHGTHLDTLFKVTELIQELNDMAFECGTNCAIIQNEVQLSEFNSIMIPAEIDMYFNEDPSIKQVIEINLATFAKIDSYNQIKDHDSTIKNNFERSLKVGFISESHSMLNK